MLNRLLFRDRLGLKFEIPHGREVDFSGQRVCLFSQFDKHAKLDPYVVHYLRALKDAGLSVVLVSSNLDLSEESIELARPLCSAILLRENRGWDFAGWALGMNVLKGIYNAEEIVLANDSVYGPLHPLPEVFEAMNKRPWHIWSITQSFEVERHLQSYFLVFKKPAIVADCFRKFWNDVCIFDEKLDVIAQYETRLTRFFESHKLMAAPYVQLAGEFSWKNPTLDHWQTLLERENSPFLKVQLLRDNPHNNDIAGWDQVVASLGYDSSLIRTHLDRTRA